MLAWSLLMVLLVGGGPPRFEHAIARALADPGLFVRSQPMVCHAVLEKQEQFRAAVLQKRVQLAKERIELDAARAAILQKREQRAKERREAMASCSPAMANANAVAVADAMAAMAADVLLAENRARAAGAAMAADVLLAEMDEEVPQLVVSTQSSGVATTQHFSICAVDDDEEEQEFFFPTFWSSRILPLQL